MAASGRIDFLISNAAVRRQTPFPEMSVDRHRISMRTGPRR
jgi:hypothetical protein